MAVLDATIKAIAAAIMQSSFVIAPRRTSGLPRELRHNMRAIYCENRNGATLQTLFSGPRPPWIISLNTRLLGPGWVLLAWPFLLTGRLLAATTKEEQS